MMKKTLFSLAVILFAVFLASCDNDEKTDLEENGTRGNPCYGNNTCNDGLTCEDGVCVEIDDVDLEEEDSEEKPDIDEVEEDSESTDNDAEVTGMIIYVNSSATGNENGTSWENAFTDLQDALAASIAGDEIWVAAGTYYPTSGEDRGISFEMVDGVSIYGGFSGIETERDERDWEENETILSGDIGIKDDISDNTYHVVIGSDNSVFDGFTVSDGNADEEDTVNSCAGLVNHKVDNTISNVIFKNNTAWYGGGLCNFKSGPLIENCTFIENNSFNEGGGIHNILSDPTIKDCVFKMNTAGKEVGSYSYGGGIYNENSTVEIIDSVFKENTAFSSGAGVFSDFSTVKMVDCMFEANSASSGAGIANLSSNILVENGSFIKNKVTSWGGAAINSGNIPVLGNKVTFKNCIFNENEALEGGAITSLELSFTMVEECTFQNNSSNIQFLNGDNSGNYGESGGAIRIYNSSISISDSIFKDNKTGYSGGAIEVLKGYLSVRNSIFENNIAYWAGGGISCEKCSKFEVSNCFFKGNSAHRGGGLSNDEGSANLINNVFYKNTASKDYDQTGRARGGAIHNIDGDNTFMLVQNHTFFKNNSENDEGDIYNYNSRVQVDNSIFRQGVGESTNKTESEDSEYFIEISYSNYEGGFEGVGNIDADPFFVDADNGSLGLKTGSPSINKGDFSVLESMWSDYMLETDINGDPRVVGDEIDMGAYEFQGE